MQTAPSVVICLDREYRILEFNPEAERLFGRKRANVLGKDYLELFLPDNAREAVAADIEKVLAGVPTRGFENTVMTKDKQERILRWNVGRILDFEGKPASVVAFGQDITERKKAEEALKMSELRFRSLIEQTTDAVFCYEYDPPIPTDLAIEEQVKLLYGGILVECNDVCAKSYSDQRAEEVIGRRLTELFGTKRRSLDKLFTALIEGNYRIVDGEGVEKLEDGTERYYLNNGHGIVEDGKLLRVWGTFRDITARKQAEEALRESEEKYRSLVEQSLQGIIIFHDFQIVFANPTAAKIAGLTLEEALALSPEDIKAFIPVEERATVLQRFEDRLAGMPVQHNYELRLMRQNGNEFWLDVFISQIEYLGKFATQVAFIDISERKKTEKELQESEEKFRTLSNAAFEGIAITERGRIVDANATFTDLFGYYFDEIIGKGVEILVAPEDRKLVAETA